MGGGGGTTAYLCGMFFSIVPTTASFWNNFETQKRSVDVGGSAILEVSHSDEHEGVVCWKLHWA